jgi:hypothetical protein
MRASLPWPHALAAHSIADMDNAIAVRAPLNNLAWLIAVSP